MAKQHITIIWASVFHYILPYKIYPSFEYFTWAFSWCARKKKKRNENQFSTQIRAYISQKRERARGKAQESSYPAVTQTQNRGFGVSTVSQLSDISDSFLQMRRISINHI